MAAAKQKGGGDRLISKNRRASFNYELGDAYEAGLVLIGSEARSLRENTADLTDAWVDIDGRNEAWVKGMRVPPLKHAAFGHDERRPRKLLLHREQIDKLRGLVERVPGGPVAAGVVAPHHQHRHPDVLGEQGARDGGEQTGAVARAGVGGDGAAVLDAGQALQGRGHDGA